MTNVTDGEAVARLLVDEYLNNFKTKHPVFMETMAGQEPKVRENCTYLGYAWLEGLSEVSCNDFRNESSKLLADDICMHVKQKPVLHQIPYSGATEMEADYGSDEQMAMLLALYLLADSKDKYRGFIRYALRTQRTLQQNLTRFFVEWFDREKEQSPFLETAGRICSEHPLPYI